MSFQPNPGDEVVINDIAYTIGQHPAAPGLAYAQAGRQGIVYQLIPRDGSVYGAKALKVFFPKFRIPAMVYQSEHMEPYSELPGLQVCRREVLTPERNGALIGEHPDLLYAVLMPWVQGLTWFDVISDQKQLTSEESLRLARALAGTGSAMEQRGLAHCDMSAPNVMIPFFSEVQNSELTSAVELVDVEQMYGSKMDRPDALLAGSPGYAAHRTVHSGLWSSYADRFAGAVIIAEMLCWSDPVIVEKAWGESYFDQHEMQTSSERYFAMRSSLEKRWGSKLSDLFIRAWESHDLSSCPTFGEWYIALASADTEQADALLASPVEMQEDAEHLSEAHSHMGTARNAAQSDNDGETTADLSGAKQAPEQEAVVNRLFLQARALEDEHKPAAALEVYRSLYHFIPSNSAMQMEVEAAIKELEERIHGNKESTEPVPIPFYRSKKFMISSAVIIVLLVGGVPTVKILADQAEVKQQEATRLAEAKAAEQAAAAKLQQEEHDKQKADEAAKLKAEEQKKLAQAKQEEAEAKKKEEERKALQEKYDKQAKYEALLAKQEQQQKEAARKALQEKYDQQAKYEAYLVWKKENDAKIAKQKAEAEAKRKQELAQKEALKKKRAQNVVTLIAHYNKAYNAQKGRKTDNALSYARDFKNLYNTDASYFKGVGKVAARMSAINKFLGNSKYVLPDL
ncbi:hypothetical protein HUB98_28540 [Paenibacillus barcinonensis]|uniref:Protein kinase domain-containing protein n=1 Tax=Paenibacillus barcinonensis TaxID=198119 RepID=A0A2V4WTY3_PAEBA|nr:hypothetical protein [Paenibacillus barcinonensis]PYE52087.1 hypothetical protein DFQ00_10119 [Paenibacillus barcinonensis]QKS59765.1 hypothetical protein HUB98_28540 [Paenibacillus barcinonensis]